MKTLKLTNDELDILIHGIECAAEYTGPNGETERQAMEDRLETLKLEPELPTADQGCTWTRETFCEYLRTTLIPDLEESGSSITAYNFRVALSFILNPTTLP